MCWICVFYYFEKIVLDYIKLSRGEDDSTIWILAYERVWFQRIERFDLDFNLRLRVSMEIEEIEGSGGMEGIEETGSGGEIEGLR